jgi:hypothetical protein
LQVMVMGLVYLLQVMVLVLGYYIQLTPRHQNYNPVLVLVYVYWSELVYVLQVLVMVMV